MAEEQIAAHKVTKPIQLLAAWLVGMTVIDGMFIGGALNLESGSWERGLLVVAAVVNVPLFLIALFVLQTKFRAELQEDPFYFQYISRKSDAVINLNRADLQESKIEVLRERLETTVPSLSSPVLDWQHWGVGLNQHRTDFHEIKTALRDAGIPVTGVFGADAVGTPDRWVIAISNSLSFPYVSSLLRVLVKFDFDAFELWDPIPEAGENEDVLIGSYGVDSPVKITDELRMQLEQDFDALDFQRYILRHQEPKKQREA